MNQSAYIVLTTILFSVNFNLAHGRDGSDEQLAFNKSPGSYRVFSTYIVGGFLGSSVMKKKI